MKCIKLIKKSHYGQPETIKRVSDSIADDIVNSGLGKYVPKSDWKQQKNNVVVENSDVGNKKGKKKK
jgi:hypothetical protein